MDQINKHIVNAYEITKRSEQLIHTITRYTDKNLSALLDDIGVNDEIQSIDIKPVRQHVSIF